MKIGPRVEDGQPNTRLAQPLPRKQGWIGRVVLDDEDGRMDGRVEGAHSIGR